MGVCAFLFLALTAVLQAGDIEHTVQSGDTVHSLARRYGVKAEEILFLNGIEDARKIMMGQNLRIPGGPIMAEPVPAPAAPQKPLVVEHKAVKGDTLSALARAYHIGLQSLLDANGFSRNKTLKIGETVKIPLPEAPVAALPAPQKPLIVEHKAVKDDTLSTLARAYNVGLQSLLDTNGFSINKKLKIGETVKIPLPPGATVAENAAPTAPDKKSAKTPPPERAIRPPSPSARSVDTRLSWPIAIKEAAYMTGKLDGVVLTGEKAAPVQSISSGTIESAGPYRGFGRVAVVRSDSGYIYVYGGCETLSVRAGKRIAPGEEIGKLGLDAVSQKPRLFFMVYNGSTAIDPAKAPRS